VQRKRAKYARRKIQNANRWWSCGHGLNIGNMVSLCALFIVGCVLAVGAFSGIAAAIILPRVDSAHWNDVNYDNVSATEIWFPLALHVSLAVLATVVISTGRLQKPEIDADKELRRQFIHVMQDTMDTSEL
jgi:hypothetical protein